MDSEFEDFDDEKFSDNELEEDTLDEESVLDIIVAEELDERFIDGTMELDLNEDPDSLDFDEDNPEDFDSQLE